MASVDQRGDFPTSSADRISPTFYQGWNLLQAKLTAMRSSFTSATYFAILINGADHVQQ